MNLTVALRNIDGAMEEAALNLGARGLRLFLRVSFRSRMPGFVAGVSLVFIKVFDDLGTPLVLGATNLLAPQAYLRITPGRPGRPARLCDQRIMIAFSILALWLSARMLKGKDYSTLQKGGSSLAARTLGRGGAARLWMDRAGAPGRAVAAPRRAAAVLRQGLELRAAAGRLHAGALRDRLRRLVAA